MAGSRPSFAEWSFGDKAIDPIMLQGKYINARSTMLAAGPPQFSDLSSNGTDGEMVFPLGFIENFGITQQKNLQRMYEIGSDRAYFIPGRTLCSSNLGRVLFHGPSLMRVLYAYYPQSKINLTSDTPADEVKISYTSDSTQTDCLPFIEESPGTVINADDCTPSEQSPTFYMNLASNLFDHPLGLLVYMKDIKNEYYSAFYLEQCYITTHNMNINATSTVVAEGVGLQFDRIVPVDMSV